MKKLLAIILAAILCLGLMAGCGQTTIIVQDGDSGNDATPTPEVTEPAAEETPAESEAPVADDTPLPEGQLKTGLALVSVVSDSSKAATAEADGNAQADTTFVSVLVDGDGVIQDCLIDCVQTKIAVSHNNKLDRQVPLTHGSQFHQRHLERTITADSNDLCIRQCGTYTNSCWDGIAHCAKTACCQETSMLHDIIIC